MQRIKVLMVCLGNICRSPTAEVVFQEKLNQQNLAVHFELDSAGTGDWHIGHSPDDRATQAAAKRQIDLSSLKARQVTHTDFEEFDYIFAMDKENLKNLTQLSSPQHHDKLELFLEGEQGYDEVPDPYYSGEEGFELVLDLIESASDRIIEKMVAKHNLKSE